MKNPQKKNHIDKNIIFGKYSFLMIADKILKSGFDINYKINEKYGRIEDFPLELKQKYRLKEASIKEYLKSKKI